MQNTRNAPRSGTDAKNTFPNFLNLLECLSNVFKMYVYPISNISATPFLVNCLNAKTMWEQDKKIKHFRVYTFFLDFRGFFKT